MVGSTLASCIPKTVPYSENMRPIVLHTDFDIFYIINPDRPPKDDHQVELNVSHCAKTYLKLPWTPRNSGGGNKERADQSTPAVWWVRVCAAAVA